IKCLLICSAVPRGLCGDPRIFDDLKKMPQVFRNPGGSPALQNDGCIRRHERSHKRFFTTLKKRLPVSQSLLGSGYAGLANVSRSFDYSDGVTRQQEVSGQGSPKDLNPLRLLLSRWRYMTTSL